MSGALRIVFTWLLAAALPLQGSAAASMTLCGTLGEGAPAVRHVHDAHDGPASTLDSASVHDSVQGHGGHHQDPDTPRPPRSAASVPRAARDGHRRRGLRVDLGRPVRILRFAHRDRGSPLLHRRARATSPNFLLRLTPRARSGRLRPVATSWRDATRRVAMTSPARDLHNRRSSDVFTCRVAGWAAPPRSALEPARFVPCDRPYRGVGRGTASRRCANPWRPRCLRRGPGASTRHASSPGTT